MKYTKAIFDDIFMNYNIDKNRVHLIGISNGGFFASLVAVKFNKIIASACIYMGGTAEDVTDLFPEVDRKVPLLFVIGTKDRMMRFTQDARELFTAGGYYVEFVTVEGVGHVYITNKERQIWNFFSRYSLLDMPSPIEQKVLPKKKSKRG